MMMEQTRKNDNYIHSSEYQVLNYLINNPDLTDVTESLFSNNAAKAVFRAINNLREIGEEINHGSLYRESNKINSIIEMSMIQGVFELVSNVSNYKSALQELIANSRKVALQEQIAKLQVLLLSSPNILDVNEVNTILTQSQEIIINGGKKIKEQTMTECLNTYEEELLIRKKGLYHKFNDIFLDKYLIRKASPGQVILIAGATGTGKSAYGLNLICQMIQANIPCQYFSLEMDTISTMDRFMSIVTGIPVSEFYTSGDRIDPLIDKVKETREEFKAIKYSFIDDPSIGLDDISRSIKEYKIRHKTGYLCVFIDLITQVKDFVDTASSRGTLASTIELAVNKLNALAKKENVCIIALAQMNRDADSMRINSIQDINKLRPTLNNVKNSGALGERARTVISVFRPKYYAKRLFPDDPQGEIMSDVLEVQILKQSMGDVGVIGRYNFNGPTFACAPLTNEEGELEV